MSVHPSEGVEKANIPVFVIIGVVAFLVIFSGVIIYRSMASSGPVPVKTATSDWLEKIARESKGDFTKLSPADQAKLNSFPPPGSGPKWLKLKYDSLR